MISCGQAKQQHQQRHVKLHLGSRLACCLMLCLHSIASETGSAPGRYTLQYLGASGCQQALQLLT